MKRSLLLFAPLVLTAAAHAQVGSIASINAKFTGLKLGGAGKVTFNGNETTVGIGKLGFDATINGKTVPALTVCADFSAALDGDTHSYAPSLTPNDFSPAGRAGKIVATYFAQADTKEKAQGLQLAVWEALADNGSTFSNEGKFKVGTDFGSPATHGSALYYATQYYGATAGQAAWFKTGEHGGQSQMTPVPEPASLCALAVGGAALLRRRRAKRA